MENLGILRFVILCALATIIYGRPTSDYGAKTEEFKQERFEVEELREIRPCYARRLEVKLDIKEFGDIKEDPHYSPECSDDGVTWKAAQCDHHDEGTCFCVHEESGEIEEHTRDLGLNKEALRCGLRRTAYADHTGHECFHMRDEFNHMQQEFGLTGHSPLAYYPICTKEGKFMALQSNDRSMYFCVDTDTGDVIPDTMTKAGTMPPLNEYICQAYDKVWQEFKLWNTSHGVEEHENEINESSCSDGYIFTECGCPKLCTEKTTLETLEESCVCKRACICPNGKLELDGECVSLEECNEARPASKIPQADKLDSLTNGDFSRWREFQENNPNAVLESYYSLGMGGEPRENIGGAIGFDEDPNARMFFAEGPPPEEPIEGGHFGGEPVPIPGENWPFLLQVLQPGGPNPNEVQEVQEQFESTSEPEITQEPESVEEGYEETELDEDGYFPENENEFEEEEKFTEELIPEGEYNEIRFPQQEEEESYYYEEEHEYYEEENNYQEIPTEGQQEEESEYEYEEEENVGFSVQEEENTEPEYELEYYPTEQPEEYAEEYTESYPGEEEYNPPVEHEEEYHEEEEEQDKEEENLFVTEKPENFEEEENNEFQEEGENNNLFVEEQENLEEFEEENENVEPTEEILEPEEFENIQQEELEPEQFEEEELQEQQEEENEIDERLIKEELTDHQAEFSSVPPPEHDEENQEQVTPPCEEDVSEEPVVQDLSETDEEIVDRVLTTNGAIPTPKPIEAVLEKQSQSVKKNLGG